jgi:NAD-dependent SIR2 family protein deacetylase
MNNEHIVILTGAGISEERGLPTFRGKDGLWENRRLEEIATIEVLEAHPADCLCYFIKLSFLKPRTEGMRCV